METMYDRIKKWRDNLGWSQEELAKKVGYADKTSIAKIEAGKVDLPQSKIVAFSRALSTTTSYLMDGENDYQPVTIAAHLDTDDLTQGELDDVATYIEFLRNRRNRRK